MLYSIFMLISGIYVGQEYDVIPSIKLVTINLINYVRNNLENNVENTIIIKETFIQKIIKLLF